MILRLLTFFSQVVLFGFALMFGTFVPVKFQLISDIACAADVTLAWNPNSESNLAGYKLYYDSENDNESYTGKDANEGESPIIIYLNELENIKSPSYTISGLEDGTCYYFTLTAFNQDEVESDFSDEVGIGNIKAGGGNCFILSLIGK